MIRSYHKHELHLGAGGSGKTYYNLFKDRGLKNICYVAPSWKLAADMWIKYKKEFNKEIASIPIHYILEEPYAKTKGWIYRYGVYIIDEASMITEYTKKKLMKILPRTIFLGDLLCQIEPMIDMPHLLKKYGCAKDIPEDELKMMNIDGFDFIMEHKEIYRFECEKLKKLALWIRENINERIDYKKLGINIITKDELKNIYKKEDIILVSRGATNNKSSNYNNEYNEIFKEIPKYKIIKNTKIHKNGEIIFENIGKECEFRHGYTIHSVQGITFDKNIFIDLRKITGNRMFYTAISRARHLHQLNLII
tara:strand:+ start:71 stop:994 length:924 start_codon:yes stop_codon:yes gene_type:complete